MDDERLRAFVKEELDRREAEAQKLCPHIEGKIPPGGNLDNLMCAACGKVLDESDLDGSGSEPPSTPGMAKYHGVGDR